MFGKRGGGNNAGGFGKSPGLSTEIKETISNVAEPAETLTGAPAESGQSAAPADAVSDQAAAPSPQSANPAQSAAPAAPAAAQVRTEKPEPMPNLMTQKPVESVQEKSEHYYDVKTTVFSALIDTIDLSQLSKLDNDGAREEIRDIVNDIISIKNIVMSIAEQEELLSDICNDVLVTDRSSLCWSAMISPTSWSTAPTTPISKSTARSSGHASSSATMTN